MKLIAVYSVWDDYEMCLHSMKNIAPLVDGIIVIASEMSNYAEKSKIPMCWREDTESSTVHFKLFQFEPAPTDPRENETNKRNYGLSKAIEAGATHFICLDADEMYESEPFLKEKQRFIDNPNLQGLVCRSQVYFKSPTLTIGLDTTLVPFIHKITPGLQHEFNRKYPFAWTDQDGKPFTDKKRIRIDPTRSLNINSGVEWSEIIMRHYSWVRRDIEKKIRNSTARQNIENSTIRQDFLTAKEGQLCQFYNKQLARCPNLFGLPEM
jgi:hypothetical protein